MLQVTINPSDGAPIYLQLVRQIKRLVAVGRLQPGDELPPVRALAQRLLINPNTVVRAYRELESAGLLEKRRGAGTFISAKGIPYSDIECRRILAERADALLIEARTLGYSLEQITELLKERDVALRSNGLAVDT